jgi:hypothetical protein
VEQDMENWREELAALKAALAVQQVALRALAHSHPQPAVVLEHWNRLRVDCVAAAYGTAGDGDGWLTTQVHARAEAWTAELQRAAAAQPLTA